MEQIRTSKTCKNFMMMEAKKQNQPRVEVGSGHLPSRSHGDLSPLNQALGLNLRHRREEGGSICQGPGNKTERSHARSVESLIA